jgi:phosphohistidine phosphatase
MPTLVLMRHANTKPPQASMRDFDRPLSDAGWAEANQAANLFYATGLKITQTFCSPACRTEQTLACIRKTILLQDSAIFFLPELYSGDVSHYRDTQSKVANDAVAMIIGHNPMIERFAFDLASNGGDADLRRLKMGFPTAAIAVIKFEPDFDIAYPQGQLLQFLTAN